MNTNSFILFLTLLLFDTCLVNNNSLVSVQQKHTMRLNTNPTSDNPSTEQRLLQMLDRKDFFRLKTLLQEKRMNYLNILYCILKLTCKMPSIKLSNLC